MTPTLTNDSAEGVSRVRSTGFVRRIATKAWRILTRADSRLANKLVRMLSAEMMYKAECFDYICWLEETQQSENVKGAAFLVLASDGTTCWGKSYADAVKVAMHHDKELYDAVRDFEASEPENPPNDRTEPR